MTQLVSRDATIIARLAVTLAVLDAQAMRPTRLPKILRQAFGHIASGEISRAGSILG
jgi:acyl-CoA thioesterase FadM